MKNLPATAPPLAEGRLRLADGRLLGYAEYGRPTGTPLFYFHGFPACRREAALAAGSADRLGVRLIAADRPGLGLSDPSPRRTLADWPADVTFLADTLGIDRFAVLGVSGGGPYAAACAALIPKRLNAAGIVGSFGPLQTGATAGMPLLSRLCLTLFRHAPSLATIALAPLLAAARLRPALTFTLLTRSLPPADRLALQGEARWALVASYAEALRSRRTALARELELMVHPWGFALDRIFLPVHLWHGEADATVPADLGRQLAAACPASIPHFFPDEGHFSLPIGHMDEILATLTGSGKEMEGLPLFVYGTLRPGEKNYGRYLQGRTLRQSPARVAGSLYFLQDGGYPYLIPGEGVVHGELIEIEPALYRQTLAAIDRLEEYDPADETASVYLRRRTAVQLPDGSRAAAWTYFWNRQVRGEKIVGGDFRQRPGSRSKSE